jgi:DNA-binding beta-propeller fold protein YncE
MNGHAVGAGRGRLLLCAAVALCLSAAGLGGPAAAPAAAPEPIFVFTPPENNPDPALPFEGPCGVAVGPDLNYFYVSDYYHNAVDVFTSTTEFVTQITNVDPLDGPCHLAAAEGGPLYVNSFHRHVEKFLPNAFPPFAAIPPSIPATAYASAGIVDSANPTGVAVEPLTGNVYVNDRTHVAVYDSTGAPVLDGSEPLRIGAGSLGDGYGLAVSEFPATAGRVYVPDHADDTVKIYDPAVDLAEPVAVIDGSNTPAGHFTSLRDSAVAVDRVRGVVYVIDNLQPQYTERPQAVVHVFDATGAYLGRLKFNVVHGQPSGLAVDNSTSVTSQGRVYVTSGNTAGGVLYAYPPNSAIAGPGVPAVQTLAVRRTGDGEGSVTSKPAGMDCRTECVGEFLSASEVPLTATPRDDSVFAGWSGGGCSGGGTCVVEMSQARSVSAEFEARPAPSVRPTRSSTATASATASSAGPVAGASEIAQKGNLRVTVRGKLSPQRLPRRGVSPIAVSVGGKITTTDGEPPPQLRRLRIELNRNGRLDTRGLPVCRAKQIHPASSAQALRACRSALVGQGHFSVDVVLSGQDPYPTKGRLLVFNATHKGRPALIGQIYSARPFTTSFLVPFTIGKTKRGRYGTVLTAALPKALGSWGHVTGIDLTLSRRYSFRGRRHSFIRAGCPAPKGFPGALFSLARTSFGFAGGRTLTSTLTRSCKVR